MRASEGTGRPSAVGSQATHDSASLAARVKGGRIAFKAVCKRGPPASKGLDCPWGIRDFRADRESPSAGTSAQLKRRSPRTLSWRISMLPTKFHSCPACNSTGRHAETRTFYPGRAWSETRVPRKAITATWIHSDLTPSSRLQQDRIRACRPGLPEELKAAMPTSECVSLVRGSPRIWSNLSAEDYNEPGRQWRRPHSSGTWEVVQAVPGAVEDVLVQFHSDWHCYRVGSRVGGNTKTGAVQLFANA
jgi:hypothetical protein